MKLHEALNKPAKYYWAEQKDHRWEGYFRIGDFLYAFEARKELEKGKSDLYPGEWEVYFTKKDKVIKGILRILLLEQVVSL